MVFTGFLILVNMGAHWFDPRVDVRKYYYYKGVDKTFGKAWNGMSITQMKEYIEKIIYEVMFCLVSNGFE